MKIFFSTSPIMFSGHSIEIARLRGMESTDIYLVACRITISSLIDGSKIFDPIESHHFVNSLILLILRDHTRPLYEHPTDVSSPFSYPVTNMFDLILFFCCASVNAFSISEPACIVKLRSVLKVSFKPTLVTLIRCIRPIHLNILVASIMLADSSVMAFARFSKRDPLSEQLINSNFC